MTSAIEVLQTELDALQALQDQCVTESGHVKSDRRYDYQRYIRRSKVLWNKIMAALEMQKIENDILQEYKLRRA